MCEPALENVAGYETVLSGRKRGGGLGKLVLFILDSSVKIFRHKWYHS